ncbi:MAG: metalloregulator ArsR/SmtB family transcription factor [Candidatus Krumholzibacteriaceae bacterium]
MRGQESRFPFELVARRLKALADCSRLSVLQSLCDGEKSVTELVERTGLGQTNVSKHLRILKADGFVLARRNRRNIIYRVSGTLHEEICTLICRSMKEKATADNRQLERYLDRRRARKAG